MSITTEFRTALPTQIVGTHRAVTSSNPGAGWLAARRGGLGWDASVLTQTAPLDNQAETSPRRAPAAPRSPSSPPRLPTDALTTSTSATGTSSGHGFSLFLMLATAGWALVLVGRRTLPSVRNLKQRTDRPLVSPG
jgi:hypothetical protein